jgi:hypothetical protein
MFLVGVKNYPGEKIRIKIDEYVTFKTLAIASL